MRTTIPQRMLTGGGGLSLRLLEAGATAGPAVLFLHGFSQSAWIWQSQLTGPLAADHRLAALDLRGHGGSSKPLDAAAYQSAPLWADDIAAAIAALGVRPVTLVACSYGGLVACDYVRKYGTSRLSGLVFAGALTRLGDQEALALLGPKVLPLVPGLFAQDLATAVPALTAFIQECHASPLQDTELYQMLGFNCVVPSEVRAALFSRALVNDDVLEAIRVPTLVVHGTADSVVLPAAATRLKAQLATSRLVMIDGAGHCLFKDRDDQFDQELMKFIRSTLS